MSKSLDRLVDRLIQKETIRLKRLKRSLEFYKKRVDELERNKDKFPEPYLTMICNILANGEISVLKQRTD